MNEFNEDPETIDEEIRFFAKLDKASIEQYDPEQAVSKCGKRWAVALIGGNGHPVAFDSRREAVTVAVSHHAMKQEQYQHPSDFFTLCSLRAEDRLKRAEALKYSHMSEMEVFSIVQQEQEQERLARVEARHNRLEEEQGMSV
jgi:hypothetical protein